MKPIKHRAKTQAPAQVSSEGHPSWPLSRLQSQINQLFNESFDWFGPWTTPQASGGPAVSVIEDKNQVVVKAELPGMKKDEIEVYISGDSLNIAGERKENTESEPGETVRKERCSGRFHRLIELPAGVEAGKVEAQYKDGVLTIHCLKTEAARRKQIEIKVT